MTTALDRGLGWLARIGTLAGGVLVATALVEEASRFFMDDLNGLRITPAVALARGYAMYAPPDHGPISEYLYPPLSAVYFLPAALASSPSAILLIAGLLNLIAFAVPTIILHRHAAAAPWRHLATVLFALLVIQDLGLRYVATSVHVDALAIGLAALAVVAAWAAGDSARRLAGSAALAVCAAWTKQTIVPLAIGIVGYVWWSVGWRAARTWIVAAGTIATAVSAVMIGVFGWETLVFNLLTVPAGHPFYGEATGGKLAGLRLSAVALVHTGALPVAVLMGLTMAPSVADRRPPLWHALAWAAVAMVPTSIMGAAKFLAYLSAHAPATYLATAAATTGLAGLAYHPDRRWRAAAASALIGLVAWESVAILDRIAGSLPSIPAALARWRDNPHEAAVAFARAHRGEVWFPRHPLASLLADERLDHSDFGIYDRELAGHPPSDAHVRSHLPPRLRWILYREPVGAFTWVREPTARFPTCRPVATPPDLTGWRMFECPAAAP